MDLTPQINYFFQNSMRQTLSVSGEENAAYSPANLYMALSLGAELTAGDTRQQILDALGANALTTEDSAKVIALLNAAPNGVQSWSQDIDGLVQTSLNLGVVTLGEHLELTFALRSSVNQEKLNLQEKLTELAKFYDAEASHKGDYPAWEYKKDSDLRDTMVRVYEEMYGQKPGVFAIHAGLECGLLSEKIEGLDCISFGPQAYDIHTPRERLNIASTQRLWKFLQEVLKNL